MTISTPSTSPSSSRPSSSFPPASSRGLSAIGALATRNRVLYVEEPTGVIEIFRPRPSVALTVVTGHLSTEMAERIIEAVEPHYTLGTRFHTFHDWSEMTTYDSNARLRLTAFSVTHFRNMLSMRLLVLSKVVAMGVSTAGLATALVGLRIDAGTCRREFEQALAKIFLR